jgi:uncharacterized protein YlaI
MSNRRRAEHRAARRLSERIHRTRQTRARAVIDLRCPDCSARPTINTDSRGVTHLTFDHDDDCEAVDPLALSAVRAASN